MGETLPPRPVPQAKKTAEREPAQKTSLDRALEFATQRSSLYALGEENLRKAFVSDFRENPDGTVSGKLAFRGDKNHTKWIGLKHIIPAAYVSVTITPTIGDAIEGTRRSDGSFYDKAGKYVAVWEGYSFKAAKTDNSGAFISVKPPESVLETVSEDKSLAGIMCFGDSITYNAKGFLEKEGAQVQAFPGKGILDDKGPLRIAFDEFIAAKKTGGYPHIHTVSLLAGVNNISSDLEVLKKKYGELIDQARSVNLRVVVCTLTPWNGKYSERINAFNDWLRSLKNDKRIAKIVDLDSAMRSHQEPEKLGVGRLHPKTAGSAFIAKQIAAAVKSLG